MAYSVQNLNRYIDDRAWQVFVFTRYRRPEYRKPLSKMQLVIFDNLSLGKSRAEISFILGAKAGNIENHLSTMRAKGWDV